MSRASFRWPDPPSVTDYACYALVRQASIGEVARAMTRARDWCRAVLDRRALTIDDPVHESADWIMWGLQGRIAEHLADLLMCLPPSLDRVCRQARTRGVDAEQLLDVAADWIEGGGRRRPPARLRPPSADRFHDIVPDLTDDQLQALRQLWRHDKASVDQPTLNWQTPQPSRANRTA
ncbi:MAG: hypothetical protein AAF211_06930 [Myxococcota bacterium]